MIIKSVLGRRLLLYIIIFSFFITLITSAAIIYSDYKTEINAINSSISRVETMYLPTLSSSLWTYDTNQIKLQLQGISSFPGVIESKIVNENGEVVESYGKLPDNEVVEQFNFPLLFDNLGTKTELGSLVISITKTELYKQLVKKFMVIITTQFFKTTTVSLFILFLVHQMITRHLNKISFWAKSINIESFDESLKLDRAPSKKDELSIVVNAFNKLRLNVRSYHQKMNAAQADLETLNLELEDRVKERTQELNDTIGELRIIKNEIELINKNTKDSIEYASLIQNSIIPSENTYKQFFKEEFIFWQPKDIVGGDIYILDALRNDNECLLMIIDCTGHGVPGAFITMLVKAIERQIVTSLSLTNEEISVSVIFTIFNKELKKILKQDEGSTGLSNVGFDGAILYYSKDKSIMKYSGSNTPLFYVKQGDLQIIKGDKQSIGYKSSDENYHFTEHVIDVEQGMTFYMTSDGYLDQNGGKKCFPLGKKRFIEIIKNNHQEPLKAQKEIFINELKAYKGREDQTDDITLIALKI